MQGSPEVEPAFEVGGAVAKLGMLFCVGFTFYLSMKVSRFESRVIGNVRLESPDRTPVT